MIPRRRAHDLLEGLQRHAAVVLLGPRQVGKTTLALQLATSVPSLYLDLERPSDVSRMAEPELFLAGLQDQLVILDEVQRLPGLFQVLRSEIDRRRRDGVKVGQFLLLGSASDDLLHQSAESLAGRVRYMELFGLDLLEVAEGEGEQLWVRGGFPESFLAPDHATSMEWRMALLRTYLEREIPAIGTRLPAETLRRLWTMLAHAQGGLHNAARLAAGLGISGQTVDRYVDILVDLMLVRRLEPWHANVGKRLVRSPRFYVRDSGLLHALLGIESFEQLHGHPVLGSSWEGFAIENLCASLPAGASVWFYRTSAGAEIDLIIEFPGEERWAIECKYSLAPKASRGFRTACDDVGATRRIVATPGSDVWWLDPEVQVMGVEALMRALVEG